MARDWGPVRRSKYNKCGKSRDTSGDRSREPRVKSRVKTEVVNKEKRKVVQVCNWSFVIYRYYKDVSTQANERNE